MASISEELKSALKGLGRLDDATVDAFARRVQDGTDGWFPDEFAQAIRSDSLTPELWAALVDSGRNPAVPYAPAREARAMWSEVAPGRIFPADEDVSTDGIRWSVGGDD